MLGTLLDTLTLASNRLTETVCRLTAWAAIVAVTTGGFLASTVLLVVAVGGLYLFFKRRRWL